MAEKRRRTGSERRQLHRQRRGGAQAASGGSCSDGDEGRRRARRGSPNQGLGKCPGSTETRAEHARGPGLVEPRAGDVPGEHGSCAQDSTRLPGLVESRAGDAPGSTPAGGAHRTTKKQEGHRTSEYQLAGRCARQARSRQNYATQGRIKPQGRRYVDSSPEKAGASTDLHAGSSTANLQ